MSETLPEGVTRDDFEELKKAVADLANAQKELAAARTTEEREDAHEEVAEASADLSSIAKEMGIPVAKLRAAAEKAKQEDEADRLRPLIQSEVRAILDAEIPAPEEDEEKPDDEEANEPEEEEEDTAPEQSHWSQKSLTDVLRGR